MKRYPLVSIVIPTHNRKEKVVRLIKSILNSNYPRKKLEIIVVDEIGFYEILIFNWRCWKHPWAGGAEKYLYEISKRFSWDKSAEEFLKVLEGVVNEK